MSNIINNSSDLEHPTGEVSLRPDADVNSQILILGINAGLMPRVEDRQHSNYVGNEVPYSLTVIEAGATQASEVIKRWIAAAGGVAVIGGTVAAIWGTTELALKAALVGAMAVVLAAAIVGAAAVVAADVRARGDATAAQYDARARLIEAYLTADSVTSPADREGQQSRLTGEVSAAPSMAETVFVVASGPGGPDSDNRRR